MKPDHYSISEYCGQCRIDVVLELSYTYYQPAGSGSEQPVLNSFNCSDACQLLSERKCKLYAAKYNNPNG